MNGFQDDPHSREWVREKPSRRGRARRWILLVALILGVGALSGCRTIRYYGQAIHGQYQIFAHQEAVERLIGNPDSPLRLRRQLELLQQIRAFAGSELLLPVDGHYLKYVDVHRRFVVWNVQAARPFSLEPKTWWYPLVGSLEYRGYFSKSGAEAEAERLRKKGFDVFVSGVDAYSTLGWFKDPVLNTFIYRDEAELAEVIFHELGHQRVFARGDTDFNEAFATVVGQEGARRWLRQDPSGTNKFEAYLVSMRRDREFVRLVMDSRRELEALYGDHRGADGRIKAARQRPGTRAELRAGKARILGDLRKAYEILKEEWGGYSGYDAWFAHEVNNAQLNTIANYYDYVPGLEALLRMEDGNLNEFYMAAERLSEMPQKERHDWLRTIAVDPPMAPKGEVPAELKK